MRPVSQWDLRSAEPVDADRLARLWHDAWQDGHAGIVPATLAPHRTRASFRRRIDPLIPGTLLIEQQGEIAGFSALVGEELYQFHLAPWARGRGLAQRLMDATEHRFREIGVARPFVLCVEGNTRALRFYLRTGWRDTGVKVEPIPVPDGTVEVTVHRLEKELG